MKKFRLISVDVTLTSESNLIPLWTRPQVDRRKSSVRVLAPDNITPTVGPTITQRLGDRIIMVILKRFAWVNPTVGPKLGQSWAEGRA